MLLTRPARTRARRLLAVLVAAALATLALSASADAVLPAGSRIPIQVETGSSATGDPAHALTSGWWGHEGGAGNGTGTGSTFLSLDASNGTATVDDTTLAATLAALGAPDLDHVAYAIVPTSSDGSNEDPNVTAGQNAAEVFSTGRILYQGFGGALNGSTLANDSVTVVSTLSEVTNWVAAGRPVQGFDNSLVLHDSTAPGNPVSTAPQGKSILNAWPAGTNLSLVAYVTNGLDPDLDNQVPLVAVDGGTGKAKTAWMPFTTVAKPGDALRTSAGYQVAGAYAPTLSTTASWVSANGTLTATVRNKSNTTATDASGNIEFAEVVNGVRGSATSVPTVNGVASYPLPAFSTGSKIFDARYVPDGAASASYLTSDWKRTTLSATSTKLAVAGGTTSDTMTATVSPKVPGKVKFTDTTSSGTTTLGTVSVSTTTGVAKLVKALSARKHTIKAVFTPTTSTNKPSSASKTVWKPRISVTYSDSTPAHGTTPKMTVKVLATGATVTGTITITWDPPSGSTKILKYSLVNGAKTVVLPKMVLGTTKITIKYGGNSTVLAATKATLLKAH